MSRQLTTGLAIVIATAVMASTTVVPATGAHEPTQDMPETPEEFLTTFQQLEGLDGLEAHSEFEVIRSQAVQDVQVGDFTESTETRLRTVLRLLYTFDEAVNKQNNGSYQEALSLARDARDLSDQLRDSERGKQYALLANVALDRFYEETGETLLSQAEEVDSTPEQIQLLSQSAQAYDQAGATDRFGQVQLRADRVEQEFEADVESINETDEQLAGFLDDCENCGSVDRLVTSEHVGVFGLYVDSLSAEDAAQEGISLADQHGLESTETSFTADRETTAEYRQTLAVASVSLILGYSIVVGIIIAVITWRLMLWKRDFTDSQHGDVVLMGEMLNA